MTTYVYETIPKKKGQRPKRYEIQQRITEDPLTHHPETGEPIQRVITGGLGYVRSKKKPGNFHSHDSHDHDHHHDHDDHHHH